MSDYPEAEKFRSILDSAKHIVVVQADNPDADSLASSLALEHMLGDLGKQVTMYCGVDIPSYLSYMSGWDRVVKQLPKQFDASIIVDTGSDLLLEQLDLTRQKMWLKSKPCIVLDHHLSDATIEYATLMINKPVVATGELLFELSNQLEWPRNDEANELLAISILSDSLGLMSEGTSARSIQIIAELVESGVALARLDAKRRDMNRRSPELVHYKGQLLQRVEYYSENRIATITIPWAEIEEFSNLYNPSLLVMDDMRITTNTHVAIAFKLYPDGKITAKIRCNFGKGIANKLAEHFGGGGHIYASGFKIQDGRAYDEIKSETIKLASELLDALEPEN